MDAAHAVGGGHVRRCLALAAALADSGWSCSFAVSPETVAVVPALAASPFERRVLPAEGCGGDPTALRAAYDEGCDALLIDHYSLDRRFETACRGWAGRIVVIDDLANRAHDCDILVDQTPGRVPAAYAGLVHEGCLVLAGGAHALLAPGFRSARLRQGRIRNHVGHVLVSFGSTDPADGTGMAFRALAKAAPGTPATVVLGAGSRNLEAARAQAAHLSPPAEVRVEVSDMAAQMARADLAIGAGGITALERCCVGLPAVVATVADNQRPAVEALARAGALVDLGPIDGVTACALADALAALLGDGARLARLSAAAAAACDGLGAWRVGLALAPGRPASDGRPVTLRPAAAADRDGLLVWQSEPGQRRYARNPAIPTPVEHARWFAARMADPGCVLSIICHGGEAAGVLRYDWQPEAERYEVSILVSREKQGLGIGAAALALGATLLPRSAVVAEVDPRNAPSAGAFRKAGYRRVGDRHWHRSEIRG